MQKLAGSLVVILLVAIGAALVVSQSEAATPSAACSRAFGTTYSCTTQLTAGNHVALYGNPGVCHGDVVGATTSPSLRASLKIVENVSGCTHSLGSTVTITYFVPTPTPAPSPTPSPTPTPPAPVGGVVELRTDRGGRSDGDASGSSTSLPAYFVAGALLLGAGGLYVARMRKG